MNQLSAKLKIDKERIAREFYEILILYHISQQPWSKYLVFKGGTALRLAYNSPRFSDDLDFSLIKKINPSPVFKFAEKFAKNFNIQISDMWEKKDTILTEFKINEPILPQPFKIKTEISKRKTKIEYQLKLITSPTSNLQALIYTATIDSILDEKLQALAQRTQPRDIFDIWFICQIKKIDFKDTISHALKTKQINTKILKQNLRKYLPANFFIAIEEISKIISNLP
ncbi:MAG: nucleotidyl transferase AbiEii/AbiGii toxin family protein [Candidatus Kryptonium sp.]